MTTRHDIEARLTAEKRELVQLGVASLHVFGSVARGTAGEASDIDFLVAFDGPATFDRYMGLKHFLEALFQAKVDLVTTSALRPELRGTIEREAVRVA